MTRKQSIEAVERHARAEGVSVRALCALAGIDYTTFYRWTKGDGASMPRRATVEKLLNTRRNAGGALMYAKGTTVAVEKSKAEIEKMVARAKCTQFTIGSDHENHRARVQFKAQNRIIRFEIALPDRSKFAGRRGDELCASAERQKWRALVLVIKAKLEAVTSQIATFEDEFMAHIVMPNDRTVAEIVTPMVRMAYENGQMPRGLLPAPQEAK